MGRPTRGLPERVGRSRSDHEAGHDRTQASARHHNHFPGTTTHPHPEALPEADGLEITNSIRNLGENPFQESPSPKLSSGHTKVEIGEPSRLRSTSIPSPDPLGRTP